MSEQDFTAMRKAMREQFPDLMDLTENMLLGDIWKRPGLSPRDRSLVTVAALISTYRPTELRFHLKRAMENGVTKDELKAAIMHLAFYAGWPAAMTGVHVAMEVLGDEK